MSQDTRKDKRAKVVSLNVRYKSATVDEFIENHSHDVSKGGIFVKTPTPFPPGTLLKFEIRLAGDKSVISGVGRVVWKREPTQAATEKPAGMGVKFIKIDDASRAVIDRLTAAKADAGSAYTSDPAAMEDEKTAATTTSAAPTATGAAPVGTSPGPTTMRGLAAAPPSTRDMQAVSSSTMVTAPPAEATKAPASAPAAASAAQKSTQISAGTTPAAAAPAPAPTGTVRTSSVGQKTLPLGSVPPNLNLPSPTAAAKASLQNTMPTTPAMPAQSIPIAASGAPVASGPPAPIKNKPATAIGVAPPGIGSTIPEKKQPSPSKPDLGSATPSAPPSSKSSIAGPPASAGGGPPRPLTNQQRKATMMGVAPAHNFAPPAAKAAAPSPSSPSLDTDDTQQFQQTPKAPPVEETPKAPPATMADALFAGAEETKKKESEKKPAAAPMMFPVSSGPEEPVKEPTMMKQAAELLEEALKEAGGSMDEIGQNPLFNIAANAKKDATTDATDVKKDLLPASSGVATSAPGSDQSGDTIIMSKSDMSNPPPAVGTAQTERQQSPARSVPPPSSAQSPAQSVPPPAKPIGASIHEPEKKSPMGLIVGLLIVAAVVGGGVFVFKSMNSGGGGDKPVPTNSTPANTASTAATPVSATPSATPPTPASASAAPVVSATAAPAVEDAGKDAGKPIPAIAPVPAPKPVPKPKPKPAPKPTPDPGTEPATDPSPAPAPAPAPAPEPAPTATNPDP